MQVAILLLCVLYIGFHITCVCETYGLGYENGYENQYEHTFKTIDYEILCKIAYCKGPHSYFLLSILVE